MQDPAPARDAKALAQQLERDLTLPALEGEVGAGEQGHEIEQAVLEPRADLDRARELALRAGGIAAAQERLRQCQAAGRLEEGCTESASELYGVFQVLMCEEPVAAQHRVPGESIDLEEGIEGAVRRGPRLELADELRGELEIAGAEGSEQAVHPKGVAPE